MGQPPSSRNTLRDLQQAFNLQTDLCPDENGKAVRADGYMKRITGAHGSKPPVLFSASRPPAGSGALEEAVRKYANQAGDHGELETTPNSAESASR